MNVINYMYFVFLVPNESLLTQSKPSGIIHVRFRSTGVKYEVHIRQDMTVKNVIVDVCRQANADIADNCYLRYNSRELNDNDTVHQTGLDQASNSIIDLPEVGLKYIQALQTASHIGKQVFPASSKDFGYENVFQIPLPSTKEDSAPPALKSIAEQIVQRSPSHADLTKPNSLVLIPLPNFSERSIDSLPTIDLTLPLSPDQFDWNVFLECFADDLEINRTDLIVVSAQKGSTKLKIKLKSKIAQATESVQKLERKLMVLVFPKSEKFIEEHRQPNVLKAEKIYVELKNFAERKSPDDSIYLSQHEMDLALRLSERPAIINETSWNFLVDKSRQIRLIIMQSIQLCSEEYVIDHASIVYNELIYDNYHTRRDADQNERILFHGTDTSNFDGIFEKNFQYLSGVQRTDDGWYGQGIYFSSSPKKALNYVKSKSKISYLICSLVRLGKILTVRDMQFKGKPMHHDYDSHYVPIRIDGDPSVEGEQAVYEEFVIKNSEQIMPLYIVGVLKVSRFVLWRDANITNDANTSIFDAMKQQYTFNVYAAKTSKEALELLQRKLSDENMKCVVVTNGADDGRGFVKKCRSLKSSLPIVVYCKNKEYHQQWASQYEGPSINVTTSPEEVFQLINNTFQK